MSRRILDGSPSRARGFTLIEVMIAVVIIAILASVGIPLYVGYVEKARRAEAKGAILELAGRMERYYADQNTYAGASVGALMDGVTTEHGYYSLSFKALAAESYTLQATAAGAQSNDDCGSFTLTSLGVKNVEDGSLAADKCW